MRHIRPSFAAVPLALVVLAACEPSAVTAARPDATVLAAKGATHGVVHTLSGHGIVDLSSAGVPDAAFSVSAHARGDGTAFGTFWQQRASGGLNIEFTGRVTCLAVDEATGRAWVGGVIEENRSTHPAALVDTLHAVGMDVWFRVLDTGKGHEVEADRSTTLGFKHSAGIITSAEYCAVKPWPDTPTPNARTFPLAEGKLKLH